VSDGRESEDDDEEEESELQFTFCEFYVKTLKVNKANLVGS